MDYFCEVLKASFSKHKTEAGCDEAGRGCLAGPVTAAAVILPLDYHHPLLNDSKLLTRKQRETLRSQIEKDAISWAVAHAHPDEIDEMNILNATWLAMHRAIESLIVKPELLLIDGNRFNPYPGISHHCIIKGDGKFFSIAAASVLAKTARDEYMSSLDKEHPDYGWCTNVGYPTRKHRKAIKNIGITHYHRRSFQLLPAQLELFG